MPREAKRHEYGDERLTVLQLEARTGIDRRELNRWARVGKLTPQAVAQYHRRKLLRAMRRKSGLKPSTVTMRMVRGMDPVRAATLPAQSKSSRKRAEAAA